VQPRFGDRVSTRVQGTRQTPDGSLTSRGPHTKPDNYADSLQPTDAFSKQYRLLIK